MSEEQPVLEKVAVPPRARPELIKPPKGVKQVFESATEDNFESAFFGPESFKQYEDGNYFDEHPNLSEDTKLHAIVHPTARYHLADMMEIINLEARLRQGSIVS